MHFILITTTNARRDIQQAVDWENGRSNGLGERFLTQLEIKFNSIINVPFIGNIGYDTVRCTSTNIFQYLIHYVVDEHRKQIIVLRVMHTRQKPIY